jgi:hypothetical protein
MLGESNEGLGEWLEWWSSNLSTAIKRKRKQKDVL